MQILPNFFVFLLTFLLTVRRLVSRQPGMADIVSVLQYCVLTGLSTGLGVDLARLTLCLPSASSVLMVRAICFKNFFVTFCTSTFSELVGLAVDLVD